MRLRLTSASPFLSGNVLNTGPIWLCNEIVLQNEVQAYIIVNAVAAAVPLALALFWDYAKHFWSEGHHSFDWLID